MSCKWFPRCGSNKSHVDWLIFLMAAISGARYDCSEQMRLWPNERLPDRGGSAAALAEKSATRPTTSRSLSCALGRRDCADPEGGARPPIPCRDGRAIKAPPGQPVLCFGPSSIDRETST